MSGREWADAPLPLLLSIGTMFAGINDQPEVLLEEDGGPIGLEADLIVAQLIDHEQQAVDHWILPKVEELLRTPRQVSLFDDGDSTVVHMPYDTWVLQTNYAEGTLSAELLDDDGREWMGDPEAERHSYSLLTVRYRRHANR